MHRSLAGTLVVFLTACGPAVSTTKDAGPKVGVSPCAGATLLTQENLMNYEASVAESFTAKGPVVLFGLPTSDETGTSALTGFFQIGGYTKGQSVKAQIVEYTGCATMGCPPGFDFSMSGANGDDIYSQEGNCGTGTFVADGGYLTPSVAAGSGTTMSGPDGSNVGLLLTPQ